MNTKWIKTNELLEVLADESPSSLKCAVIIKIEFDNKQILVFNKNLDFCECSFEWLENKRYKLDFNKAEITDYGHTLKINDYEASCRGIFESFPLQKI